MRALTELKETLKELNIPIETGVYSGTPPDEYIVLTPTYDGFDLYADDNPNFKISEIRISLFNKYNYIQLKNRLVSLLLKADFLITEMIYVGHEDNTGFHHYSVDVAKGYGYNYEEE